MTIGKLTVRSIDAGSRPTAAQCSREDGVAGGDLVERPGRVPRVGEPGDGPERLLRAGAADQDRQVALDGPRQDDRVVERVGRPDVVDGLAVEQPADEPDRLVEPVEPLPDAGPEVDPERVVLALEPGAADPEDRPAVADVIEGRRQLGGEARVPERVGPDHQAEPDPGRQRRPRGQGQPALEDGLAPRPLDRHQVIPRPERIPARRLGLQGGVAEAGPVGGLRPELGPELGRHRSTLIRFGRRRKLTRRCRVNRFRIKVSAFSGSSAW